MTRRQDAHRVTAERNGTLSSWQVGHVGAWDGEASLLAVTESSSSLENAIPLTPHHHSYPRDSLPPCTLCWAHCAPSASYSAVCFYCGPSRARYASRIRCQLDIHPIPIRPEPLHNWALAGAMRHFQESKQHTFPWFTLSPFESIYCTFSNLDLLFSSRGKTCILNTGCIFPLFHLPVRILSKLI